jgi:hypothetical protein
LSVQTLTRGDDPKVLALEHAIESTLARVFGTDTHEYQQLSVAAKLYES